MQFLNTESAAFAPKHVVYIPHNRPPETRGLKFGVGTNPNKTVMEIVKVVGEENYDRVQFLSLILCVTLPLHIPRDPMLRGLVLRQLLWYLGDWTLGDFFESNVGGQPAPKVTPHQTYPV
jgi:hypothetical protein